MFIADAAAIKVSRKLFFLVGRTWFHFAQEIISSRARFPKPIDEYGALSFFGHNIVVSEGEEWKKYRKISAPAFSDVSLLCWFGSWNHSGLTWYVPAAQQQASLGWDCQNHAGPVQRFVGESGCCFSGPCGGPHITCRLLDWSSYRNIPLRSLPGALQIALFVIGAAGMHIQSFFNFSITDTFPRIWKKCFVERGWYDYSSWPYDDLQRCSAHRYQWFHFKADGSWLGVGPDTPIAEGQAWVWRATCASLKFSMFLVHFWGNKCVDVYGGNDTGTPSGGREDGATWPV